MLNNLVSCLLTSQPFSIHGQYSEQCFCGTFQTLENSLLNFLQFFIVQLILYMRFIYKNALVEGFLTYRSLCNLRRVATILFHKLKSPLTRAINIGVMEWSVLIQQMTWVIMSSSQHLYTTQWDPVHCKLIHALHKGSLAPHSVMYKQCKHVASSTYHYCWHIKVKISPQIYHKSGSCTQILGAKSATQS